MEQIVVQTEVQPDGNILLFYVDENQEIDPNLLEQVKDESIDVPETKYIIEDTTGDSEDELDIAQATEQVQQESWPDNEITRLIVFYIDNKKTFLNGTTKSKHLWAVACKTMMTHRRPISCEIKFRMLKGRFIQAYLEKQKNSNYHWSFYDLCHQAFYDDPEVVACIKENLQKLVASETKITVTQIPATQIHATQIPATQIYATRIPATQIPATQIHATQIPATQIHATQNPATQIHATQIYATQIPATQVPATQIPVTQIPATQIPVTQIPATHTVNQDGVIIVKKVSSQVCDEKVTAMLKLYIKYKGKLNNANLSKSIWDTIALEMGEEDGNYWHRRFYNFKKHYITMLHKKKETNEEINWPYMSLYDEIYGNDKDFQRKFQLIDVKTETESDNSIPNPNIWYDSQKVFLVKYRFDCFHEFQDPTIPDAFLWHEIGRLLDKEPNSCQQKLEQLQEEHMKHLLNGDYHLLNRTPLQILLDNVIALETEAVLRKNIASTNDPWKTEEIDNMVQYFYDNMVMFKDPVCYYVCWVIIAKKLGKTVVVCNKKWNELKELYRSILNDKKENPDMQIDWRYIDVFDIIFDYGMDMKLLDGYETSVDTNKAPVPEVNKITFNDDNNSEDEETYDERGFTKNIKKQAGDEKAFKLLEYYLKNKDKFSSSQKKLALWEVIGKQIGVSATECAHRFRNFKQVYTAYVQREINKPEMPILWPYYSLCKKVFGYRAIKSKLKNGKTDADEIEDWTPKEIKQIINHFSTFYNEITDNSNDETLWSSLAEQMGRPATSLRDKFLELRKSYRKLKTMKTRNPDVKLTWKYFNMMDNIYNEAEQIKNRKKVDIEIPFNVIGKTELPDDDDYQCIIVMPEDEEMISDETVIDHAQEHSEKPKMFKWNKKAKRQLLSLYLDCRRRNMQSNEIWNEIASRMEDKTPKACKNMFVKLKNIYKTQGSSVYGKLLDRILALKKEKVKVV